MDTAGLARHGVCTCRVLSLCHIDRGLGHLDSLRGQTGRDCLLRRLDARLYRCKVILSVLLRLIEILQLKLVARGELLRLRCRVELLCGSCQRGRLARGRGLTHCCSLVYGEVRRGSDELSAVHIVSKPPVLFALLGRLPHHTRDRVKHALRVHACSNAPHRRPILSAGAAGQTRPAQTLHLCLLERLVLLRLITVCQLLELSSPGAAVCGGTSRADSLDDSWVIHRVCAALSWSRHMRSRWMIIAFVLLPVNFNDLTNNTRCFSI